MASDPERHSYFKINYTCIESFNYNLSQFFRDYDAMEASVPGLHEKLEKYIQTLNYLVRTDTTTRHHSEIMLGIERIVRKICDKLQFSYWRGTGSSSANLRVGLPYEVDVLVETGPIDVWTFGETFVHPIIRTAREAVSTGALPGWQLHGAFGHKKGACLAFEFKETTGVLIDIIPIARQRETSAELQLSSSFKNLMEKYCIDGIDFTKYTIASMYHLNRYDTGSVENQVLKSFPEKLKISLRVAKYLLQTQLALPKLCVGSKRFQPEWFTKEILDVSQTGALYGYIPAIRSYAVKFLFLHLISSTVGTEYEAKLTVPALTMCLLDMIMHNIAVSGDTQQLRKGRLQCVNVVTGESEFPTKVVIDSEIPNTGYRLFHAVTPALSVLSCEFLQQAITDDIPDANLPLINKPNPLLCDAWGAFYEMSDEKTDGSSMKAAFTERVDATFKVQQPDVHALRLWGFCRGASVDKILACRLKKHETPPWKPTPFPPYVRLPYS